MARKTIISTEVVSSPAAAPKTVAKVVKTSAKTVKSVVAAVATKVAKPRAKSSGSIHKARTTGVAAAEITAQQIADRAYFSWLERGCPAGSPEEDWFSAETELRSMAAGA